MVIAQHLQLPQYLYINNSSVRLIIRRAQISSSNAVAHRRMVSAPKQRCCPILKEFLDELYCFLIFKLRYKRMQTQIACAR